MGADTVKRFRVASGVDLRRAIALAVLVASAGFAACSNDDGGTSSADGTGADAVGADVAAGPDGADDANLSDGGELSDALDAPDANSPTDVVGSTDANAPDADSGEPQGGGNGWTVNPDIISIEGFAPLSGSADGGELVLIEGFGFTADSAVWFGDKRGRLPYVEAGTSILVETPEHTPGMVELVVLRGDGIAAVAANSYTFVSPVEIHAVVPAKGPATGGTPVTILGRGFDASTVVLFDGTPCIALTWTSSEEVHCLTPSGPAGEVNVAASTGDGFREVEDAYRYTSAPKKLTVSPNYGLAVGGTTVSIAGSAIWPDTVVRFGGVDCDILSPGDGSHVVVTAPGGSVGPVDVELETSEGLGRVDDGFVYLDGAPQAPKLLALQPLSGPVAGGTTVQVIAQGLDLLPDADSAVLRFGGTAALDFSIQPATNSIWATTPAGFSPGPVDVRLTWPDGHSTLANGFLYTPGLTVSTVQPNTGPQTGGTKVLISGSGFAGGQMNVEFGPLPAASVIVVDEQTLQAVTPPGSVGAVDVRVRRGAQEAVKADGFVYAPPGVIALYALSPSLGSIAGDTYVELFGSGFEDGALVWFGDVQAPWVQVVSPGRIATRTPPQPVSTVDVTVVTGGLAKKLKAAYTYFNPAASQGGVWGDDVDGSVNVTVYDNATGAPVEDATVILGSGDAAWTKLTDENGQTTFSDPKVDGAVQISASKEGYSAYSVVVFDAENVTVFLQPDVPPTPGGGGQNPVGPPQVRGRVIGIGKYIVAPPTDCDDVLDPTQPALCAPCESEGECSGLDAGVCAKLWQPGWAQESRCTLTCGADSDCPSAYVCAVTPKGGYCHPSPPEQAAYCVISKDSPFSITGTPGPANFADADGYYQIYSRSGTVAVICYGGFMDAGNQFIPVIMGIRRNVHPIPDQIIEDQDVELTIPLESQLRGRLYLPPTSSFGTQVPDFRISLELNGDDGYIDMPRLPQTPLTSADPNVPLVFHDYPAVLTGPLAGAKYTIYTSVFAKEPQQSPFSVSLLRRIQTIHGPTILARPPEQTWATGPAAIDFDLSDVWAVSNDFVIAVGEGGRIVVGSNIGWGAQPSPTKADLHALWGASPSAVWAVGDAGTILFFDGIKWVVQASGVPFALRDVWGTAPNDVWAVGDGGILHFNGASWVYTPISHAKGLRGVGGLPDGRAIAVGQDGRVLVHANDAPNSGWLASFAAEGSALRGVHVQPDGTAWAASDGGALLRLSVDGPQSAEWVQTPVAVSLHEVWGRGSELWVGGDAATILRWDGSTWHNESPASARVDVRGIHAAANAQGLAAATLYAVGPYSFPVGPFLPFPAITYPVPNTPFIGDALGWTVPSVVVPDYTSVTLANQSGKPFWQFIVAGTTGLVPLPNFADLAGFTPVPTEGTIRMGMTHVLSVDNDPFNINQYTTMDFALFKRLSWSNRQVQFN